MNAYLFDLDGTLVDSIGDIAQCANIVREAFGLPRLSESLLVTFIGEGARHLIERTLRAGQPGPIDEARIEEGLSLWMKLYETHMLDRTRLFDGIAEALGSLEGPKAIVTNKPGVNARKLCARIGLDRLCPTIVGAGDGAARKPARDGIDLALSRIGEVERAVFIGDSHIDAQAARNADLPFVGVLWGLGTRSEMEAQGARLFAEVPGELAARCAEALCAKGG